MRFWCSVSDRCSGKIGEGKVPSACSSCVYTLCLEQRGLVIFAMIDAAAEESLEHIYMKHWWEEQHEQAVFVLPLFVLHTLWQSVCQAGMLQHSRPSLPLPYLMKSVYISGNDSPRCPGLPDTILPTYPSLSRVISKQPLSSASGKSHRTKHLSKTSPPHVCVSLVSFWIANDKWCSTEKSYQRTWQWRALKKGNNGALDWSFWRSHRQLL